MSTNPAAMHDITPEQQRAFITLETARINWRELQVFFARGQVIQVKAHLDLVEVALQFAQNDKETCQTWLAHSDIGPVADDTAQRWFNEAREIWAVVSAPWVLVQDN